MTETKTEAGAEITLDAPVPLAFSDGETGGTGESAEERRCERAARLLETGDYPDKNLRLTEDDLDGIVARFSGEASPVPVKVEHVDSPLDPLGHVRRIWRDGSALFGTLAFPDDLAAFLRRRGAAKLSVGLARTPLALREVSLVLKPRVAGAVLMGEDGSPAPNNGGEDRPLTPNSGGTGRDVAAPAGSLPTPPLLGAGGPNAEIIRLRAELTRRDAQILMRDVDAQVAAFKVQGRIVPASEAPARALLAAAGEASVTLSEGPEPIARVFRRFLEAQPPAVSFGEAVGGGGETASVFTQDEHMFLSKRLGVDPDRVAALIREEQAREDQARRAREKKGESHAH